MITALVLLDVIAALAAGAALWAALTWRSRCMRARDQITRERKLAAEEQRVILEAVRDVDRHAAWAGLDAAAAARRRAIARELLA